MNGANTEVWAKTSKKLKAIRTMRIGASHHFLRMRRKDQSWEKMENLEGIGATIANALQSCDGMYQSTCNCTPAGSMPTLAETERVIAS